METRKSWWRPLDCLKKNYCCFYKGDLQRSKNSCWSPASQSAATAYSRVRKIHLVLHYGQDLAGWIMILHGRLSKPPTECTLIGLRCIQRQFCAAAATASNPLCCVDDVRSSNTHNPLLLRLCLYLPHEWWPIKTGTLSICVGVKDQAPIVHRGMLMITNCAWVSSTNDNNVTGKPTPQGLYIQSTRFMLHWSRGSDKKMTNLCINNPSVSLLWSSNWLMHLLGLLHNPLIQGHFWGKNNQSIDKSALSQLKIMCDLKTQCCRVSLFQIWSKSGSRMQRMDSSSDCFCFFFFHCFIVISGANVRGDGSCSGSTISLRLNPDLKTVWINLSCSDRFVTAV